MCLWLSVKEEGLVSICPGEELLFPQSFSLPGAASVFAGTRQAVWPPRGFSPACVCSRPCLEL